MSPRPVPQRFDGAFWSFLRGKRWSKESRSGLSDQSFECCRVSSTLRRPFLATAAHVKTPWSREGWLDRTGSVAPAQALNTTNMPPHSDEAGTQIGQIPLVFPLRLGGAPQSDGFVFARRSERVSIVRKGDTGYGSAMAFERGNFLPGFDIP